jgi:hypothetical protein
MASDNEFTCINLATASRLVTFTLEKKIAHFISQRSESPFTPCESRRGKVTQRAEQTTTAAAAAATQ